MSLHRHAAATAFTPGPWRRAGHRSIAARVGVSRVTICKLLRALDLVRGVVLAPGRAAS